MKRFIILISLVIMGLVAAACGGGGSEAETGPIKVGAIFDLSGPTSGVGTPYADGIKAYVDWRNNNGGIEGRDMELIFQDFGYKVDQAEQLYSQFVSQDKVLVFMGWGTGDTEALRGKIADDKVPFMSASYSINLINIDEAPYNFMIGTSYSDQMVIAQQWIADQGGTKIGVLHHDSPFGQSPLPDGEEFAAANGQELLAVPMPGGATDLTAELTQIQSFGADYVIIQNVSGPAALALKNAADLGMDAQFVCLNWCADEFLIELAGDAADGAIGTLPFTPPTVPVEGDKVIREYAKSKGLDLTELGLHYSQGWYTMAVMTEGIDRVVKEGKELNGENIRAALEGIKNYDTGGVSAPISFTATDHRGNKALRLFKVEGGQWQQMGDYIDSPIEIE